MALGSISVASKLLELRATNMDMKSPPARPMQNAVDDENHQTHTVIYIFPSSVVCSTPKIRGKRHLKRFESKKHVSKPVSE